MSLFHLDIITPIRVAYSEEVDMVTVPSASGVLGILAHHQPLFARLVDGEIKITQGKEEKYLAIGGGFVEVTPRGVNILVSRAVHADELNEEEIKIAHERAKNALSQNITDAERKEAQGMFQRSLLELKVLRRRKASV